MLFMTMAFALLIKNTIIKNKNKKGLDQFLECFIWVKVDWVQPLYLQKRKLEALVEVSNHALLVMYLVAL